MPLGSSSAAPVMRPGPRFFRIEKADAGEEIGRPWGPPFEPAPRIRSPVRTPRARLALLTLDLLSTVAGPGDCRPRLAFGPRRWCGERARGPEASCSSWLRVATAAYAFDFAPYPLLFCVQFSLRCQPIIQLHPGLKAARLGTVIGSQRDTSIARTGRRSRSAGGVV